MEIVQNLTNGNMKVSENFKKHLSNRIKEAFEKKGQEIKRITFGKPLFNMLEDSKAVYGIKGSYLRNCKLTGKEIKERFMVNFSHNTISFGQFNYKGLIKIDPDKTLDPNGINAKNLEDGINIAKEVINKYN